MIVRTGLGQALACPPGTTDPSCAATPQYNPYAPPPGPGLYTPRKQAYYQPSADLLRIQKAGTDVGGEAAPGVLLGTTPVPPTGFFSAAPILGVPNWKWLLAAGVGVWALSGRSRR